MSVALLGCAGAPDHPPNLLVITADTLRADRLACYGGPADAGAAICGLAEEGTLYLWALAPSSAGGPSAASLLTSRFPSDHGLDARSSSFLRSEVTSVAESLRSAGYHTAAFVSSPELSRSRNLDQGFDHFDDRLERRAGISPARGAAETVSRTLEWIAGSEAPWAIWVHFGDLHGPYPPPATPTYEAYAERQSVRLANLDAGIARLLETVHAGEPPTEVVFAGIHGEAAGEDGHWYQHGHSLGLEQLRVPLIWRGNGFEPPGRRVVTPVSTLAVAPTLLRAAGLASQDGSEGVALSRPGDPPQTGGPRPVYAEHPSELGVASGGFFYARGRDARLGSGSLIQLSESGEPGPPLAAVGPGLATRAETLERRLAERWSPEPTQPSFPDTGDPDALFSPDTPKPPEPSEASEAPERRSEVPHTD